MTIPGSNRQSLDTRGTVVPFTASPTPEQAPGTHPVFLALHLAAKLPMHLRYFYLAVVGAMYPDDVRGRSTWRGLNRWAQDVGVSRGTAQRAMSSLVELGFLRRDYHGTVLRGGRAVPGSNSTRTPKLSFVAHPEQERASRDAARRERERAALAQLRERQPEVAAIDIARNRVHLDAAAGKLPLVDAGARLKELDRQQRELEKSCGFTWNRNTYKATVGKRTGPAPTLAGEPRADAQHVTRDTQAAAAATLDALRPAAPVAASGKRAAVEPAAWSGECSKCERLIVRRGDGQVFDADSSGVSTAHPHVCGKR